MHTYDMSPYTQEAGGSTEPQRTEKECILYSSRTYQEYPLYGHIVSSSSPVPYTAPLTVMLALHGQYCSTTTTIDAEYRLLLLNPVDTTPRSKRGRAPQSLKRLTD